MEVAFQSNDEELTVSALGKYKDLIRTGTPLKRKGSCVNLVLTRGEGSKILKL